MTDRRPLSTDLTDQGKWQAEHGATPDPIVVLSDGQTWTCAEGCRLVVPTMEHAAELHNHGMKANDVQPLAEYNIDALPELVEQLKEAARCLDAIAVARIGDAIGRLAVSRLAPIEAALDAAIEHEGGAE